MYSYLRPGFLDIAVWMDGLIESYGAQLRHWKVVRRWDLIHVGLVYVGLSTELLVYVERQ